MVDRFEDLFIQLLCFWGVEWETKGEECVCETLNPKTDRSVSHIAVSSFGDGIMIDFDDFIEVSGQDLNDFVEATEIVFSSSGIYEGRKSKGSQVANGDFVWCSVLDNFGTKIGAPNSAQILLVALSVASIFVKHERVAGLSLGFQDRIPQLLSLDGLSASTFLFVSVRG